MTKAANSNLGSSVDFVYDGLNRCMQRVTNGTPKIFSYDGWKLIAEWKANGSLSTWNLYGPGPDEILLRRISNTNYLHYHSDQFGSVKFLLDQNNVGVEKYTYDAFGAPTITDWAGNPRTESAYGNRFMFTGREYFPTIGLYDYRNRIYSPVIGRFLQIDPLGFDAGDENLFRYVGNNPVNGTDPEGTQVLSEFALEFSLSNNIVPGLSLSLKSSMTVVVAEGDFVGGGGSFGGGGAGTSFGFPGPSSGGGSSPSSGGIISGSSGSFPTGGVVAGTGLAIGTGVVVANTDAAATLAGGVLTAGPSVASVSAGAFTGITGDASIAIGVDATVGSSLSSVIAVLIAALLGF